MSAPTLHTKRAPATAPTVIEGQSESRANGSPNHVPVPSKEKNMFMIEQTTDNVNANVLDDPFVTAYAYGDLDRRRGLDRRREFADPRAAEGYERGYADAGAIVTENGRHFMRILRKAARR